MEAQNAAELVRSAEGLSLFLFGIFCAWWAQERDRNPWLWFFGGAITGPIAGLYLLYLNAQERQR